MGYIRLNNLKNYLFYKMPKCILNSESYKTKLSGYSKLGYMLILDRLGLSIKNKLIDENSNLYIYYSVKQMQDNLNISKKTAMKVFTDLIDAKLMTRIKKENKNEYVIYLFDIFKDEYKNKIMVENRNNSGVKSIPNDVENLHLNNNIYNKIKNNNKDYIKSNEFKNEKNNILVLKNKNYNQNIRHEITKKHYGRNYTNDFLENYYDNL